jgi:hypothetical protein
MAEVASDEDVGGGGIPMKLRLSLHQDSETALLAAGFYHVRGIGPLGMALTTLLPGPLLVTGTTHMNVGQLLASLKSSTIVTL